ncbi:succinic semialdehyde dehydrogenase [Cellulomonas marina]|uniref:Succinate-semialdehyde dehydrogenase / glutarate-semialdehyde dehydrogenase n=1 Tax=Cellulomonas marina TaxID=988821 RepID=A0A1I0XSQ9_9CELL|nr:succinic semialdehyde dehydrogenase [Cellulomonas marina]GIG30016.1 succinic semialdehyde dehydrogenase [Cellulomonas marina]SFB03476.1 succinate-semialdehyde dehydrogenase / glutarate-semialdehyde dehydrogenase [Cellulomonas marina]
MGPDPHLELHDPETDPLAAYVLEPADLRPLLDRVVAAPGAPTHAALTPLTGAPLVPVPQTVPDDVPATARVARAAQRLWAARPLRHRTAVLRRLHDLVLERQSDGLDLVQLETGKARAHAVDEVLDVANVARHYAVRTGAYLRDRRAPALLPLLADVRVHRRPAGVVGVVVPWNYPLSLALSDALPALVAGNAVLLRADPQTALTALWAAELCEDAGLPAGVLQVLVGGKDVAEAVVDHVDRVLFTGSTAAGRQVAARAGERLVPAVLELGGKNAAYVAADVDVATTAAALVRACFASAGQLCLAPERLYVHRDVLEAFTAALVERTERLRLGVGLDYRADMGSLTSAAQLARVVEHVEDALSAGARLLTGGEQRLDVGPLVYAPTVLTDVPEHARLHREETFGPVVALYPVASDDEAVAAMDDSAYALTASVWTRDARRGAALARRLRAGSVTVNAGPTLAWSAVGAPQGGTGASGLGYRHGREAVEAVTTAQTVAVARGVQGLAGRLGLDVGRLVAGAGDPADPDAPVGWDAFPRTLARALRVGAALRRP